MKRILFVQTAFIGDVLLGVPTLKHIRKLWPEAQVDVVVRKGISSLVRTFRLVDEVFEVTKGDAQSYETLRRNILAQNYDLVLCPHRSVRTALLLRGVGQRRVGVKSWWNLLFFNDRVAHDLSLPEPLRQMMILKPFDSTLNQKFAEYKSERVLGAGGLPLIQQDLLAELEGIATLRNEPQRLHAEVRAFLEIHQLESPILIAPGSVWPTKKWSKESFTALAKALVAQGQKVVLLGSPDEKAICDEIALKSGAINSAGIFTIPQSMELMTQSRALICNDSGPAHMAACVNLPTVSIFGPTVLSFGYRPWNNRAKVVENRSLECRPCAKHGGKKCPIGTHECMTSIKPAEVQSALTDLLKKIE